MAKKDWAPSQFPFRDPRSGKQQQGRIVNPVRAVQLGGRGETKIWDASNSANLAIQGPEKVDLKVTDKGRGKSK